MRLRGPPTACLFNNPTNSTLHAMSSPPEQQRDDMPTPVPALIVAQAGPSTPVLAAPQEASQPPIKNLILDAAPLLTLFPLRGLAQKYLIAPQVLAEIRDRKAREHFDRLGLMEGVEVVVREPDAVSLAKGAFSRFRLRAAIALSLTDPAFLTSQTVTAFAKQTGDYAVLSHTDMCVLALTYAVEVEENGHWRVKDDLHKVRPGFTHLHASTSLWSIRASEFALPLSSRR